jgi:hypothetical protein
MKREREREEGRGGEGKEDGDPSVSASEDGGVPFRMERVLHKVWAASLSACETQNQSGTHTERERERKGEREMEICCGMGYLCLNHDLLTVSRHREIQHKTTQHNTTQQQDHL